MTTDSRPDIGVLGGDAHGIPTDEYVAALRERLPSHEVVHARTPRERRAVVAEATIVTGGDVEAEWLDEAENLRLFASASAGVDPETVLTFDEHGITVTNASGVHGPSIAEHAIGAMLYFARQFDEGRRRQERREWRHFQSDGLYGNTVTVVGLGAIGESILERLAGFDVETIGVRYSPEKGGPADEVIGFDSDEFHDALSRTDYFVLACPLTETTRGLVGQAELETLSPDALLVNVARGAIVDTDALVAAISRNSLAGAALDVTDPEPLPGDHPLWTFGNVLLTPHVAGHTPRYWERRADILARNARRLEETDDVEELENRVSIDEDGEVVY